MNDIVKNNYGSLKIAFPTMRGTYMLSLYPADFQSLYPNVRLEILESHSYLLEDMLNAEADLAFFNLPVKARMLTTEIISHEELPWILPHHHPLAEMGVQKPDCKYPWMDLKYLKRRAIPFSRLRDSGLLDQLFKATGITPIIKLQTSNIAAKVQLVAKATVVVLSLKPI